MWIWDSLSSRSFSFRFTIRYPIRFCLWRELDATVHRDLNVPSIRVPMFSKIPILLFWRRNVAVLMPKEYNSSALKIVIDREDHGLVLLLFSFLMNLWSRIHTWLSSSCSAKNKQTRKLGNNCGITSSLLRFGLPILDSNTTSAYNLRITRV